MTPKDDPLELLLPRADATLLRKAHDLTKFLGLFVMESKSTHAARVGLDSERACAEWEKGVRARVESALSDLARHYLRHACGPDAIFQFGPARLTAAEAFAMLAEHGPELNFGPLFPEPGEPALAFAERVLERWQEMPENTAQRELWSARRTRARQGPLAALPLLEAGARARAKAPPEEQWLWLCGWIECLLERGAVREARALLNQHASLIAGNHRLRCLAAWCLVLCGEAQASAELYSKLRPEEICLPKALAALRQRVPDWLRYLPGREALDEAPPRLHEPSRARHSIGASACIECRLDETGEARVVRADVAPALRARMSTWTAERPAAHQETGSLEQRCVLEDRVCIEHRMSGLLRGDPLGGPQTRAIALVPLHDERARLCGWLRLEFEHHLVPRAEYLLVWSRQGEPERQAERTPLCIEGDAELREAVFQDCMRALALESPQRRWWGFALRGHEPVLVAGSLEDEGPLGQGLEFGSALRRAVDAAGHVRFDEAQPGWSLHPDSQSGLVLQLRFAGRGIGLLVVESPRRREFARLDCERHEATLEAHALALELAAFREAQRRQRRAEAYFDAHAPGFRSFAERLLRAAEREQCITLCGKLGSGRKTLARWLHAQSPAAQAEPGLLGPDADPDPRRLTEQLELLAGSTLLICELERWSPAAQRRLLEWLEEREARPRADWPRPIVLMGQIPAQAESQGRMEPALARRLERMCWRVPSLHERRGEILKLFAALLETLSRREQLRAPELDDAALALLWRQRWPGNLVELESVALRCLLFAPGRQIDVETLARLLREFGLRPLERLPSRHPDRADLLAALGTTRLGTGRVNKTRAALYLGWDPDTLVARMQDLSIPQEGPFEVPSWNGLDFPVEAAHPGSNPGSHSGANPDG